jgi:ribosome-associated heat shock protein Hsp15
LADALETSIPPRVRLDKWLWAARFYKTRSQATEAIHGGHVKGRGERLKAGHAVAVGEVIEIVRGGLVWEVEVIGLSDKRGKGADAQRLYRETEEGGKRRLAQAEAMRAAAEAAPYLKGRPTKRDRRALDRWRGGRRGHDE